MSKYLKEGIIVLLLTIVIIILLIIALYEYTPAQKNVSGVETYQRTGQTANVLQEISTSEVTEQNNESIIKSYSISASDLSIYGKTGSYDKGRGDPFADVDEEVTTTNPTQGNTSNSNTSNGNTSTNNANSTNRNNQNTSTGYFNSTGKNK